MPAVIINSMESQTLNFLRRKFSGTKYDDSKGQFVAGKTELQPAGKM